MTDAHDELTVLALRAQSGDRGALEPFVRATQRDVWRFIAHLSDVRVADDLTQETFARALVSLSRFEARSSARTWLLSIARRVVVDQVRMAQTRPRVSAGVDWVQAADRKRAEPGFESTVALTMLLDELADDRREALVLTQLLGLSYAEAAKVAGCPIGTIRSRVARARDDLLRASGQAGNVAGLG